MIMSGSFYAIIDIKDYRFNRRHPKNVISRCARYAHTICHHIQFCENNVKNVSGRYKYGYLNLYSYVSI